MSTDLELKQKYEACVDACAESLFRVAFRLTGNDTLARELVQETYLNAWKSLSTLSDPQKIRSWMFSILRNQYSKMIRVESKNLVTSEKLGEIAAPESRPPYKEAVGLALERLDEKFKMPLLLVAMERMSVDEAAQVLDVPRGTVLSRLHRGRQKLREYLIQSDIGFAAMNRESENDGI